MNKFPKKIKKLSKKKKFISDSFIKLWHQELKKISIIENFNHNYVARSKIIFRERERERGRIKTLEIGAGIGNHLYYEELKHQYYYCI